MEKLIALFQASVGKHRVITGEDVTNWKSGVLKPVNRLNTEVVVLPETTQQVSEILALCCDRGVSVVPQGGLSGLVEGTDVAKNEVALSLEKMDKIEEIDLKNGTMTVQAGVILQVAQEAAEQAGFLFGLDLGARGSATIGGNISTNAGGNRVIRYGMTRDMVLGLEAVLADGTVVSSMGKLVKDNSGYDLKQLFIGSEGTLGVVTRAVIKLFPKPVSQNVALIGVDDFDSVIHLLHQSKQRLGGNLTAFEVMWQEYFQLVTTEPAPHRAPISQDHSFYVLLESMGANQTEDHLALESVLAKALEDGRVADAALAKNQAEVGAIWAMRDDIFQVARLSVHLVGFDVSLPANEIEEYVKTVDQRLGQLSADYHCLVFGHLGDGNMHLVVTLKSDEASEKYAVEEIVYSELRERGGSISAEHGIGLQKKSFLSYTRSKEEIGLMKTIKRALDPKGVLNPGKIIDS
ncbi:MAG: FAD-binding oxidoreductase [Pseudomonadales bacterium]|nr:FAD-binding oxidoreductase [Pseudomonadales bacterium]